MIMDIAAAMESTTPQAVTKKLLDVLLRKKNEIPWKWSTLETKIGLIYGAAKRYSEVSILMCLPKLKDFQRLVQVNKWRDDAISSEKPVTKEHMNEIIEATSGSAKTLAQLCWGTAQRTGDLVQVKTENVFLRPQAKATILLASGKGVTMRRAPYAIHFVSPPGFGEHFLRALESKQKHLFTKQDQKNLSLAMKAKGYSLRSIRRGSLSLMATNGVSIPTLRSISGHQSDRMLLRYINWGIGLRTLHNEQTQATSYLW